VFWGIAIICFGRAMQVQVLRLAPDAADLAISMFSGFYNVGNGAGALLGKTVAQDFGLGWAGMCGALVATSSLVVCGVTFAVSRNSSRRNAAVLAD
jgi:DHA1 family L-arabinose/isopropyl-beta-D-thiogalactopyranoside export protein-like MFS transporter